VAATTIATAASVPEIPDVSSLPRTGLSTDDHHNDNNNIKRHLRRKRLVLENLDSIMLQKEGVDIVTDDSILHGIINEKDGGISSSTMVMRGLADEEFGREQQQQEHHQSPSSRVSTASDSNSHIIKKKNSIPETKSLGDEKHRPQYRTTKPTNDVLSAEQVMKELIDNNGDNRFLQVMSMSMSM
jgi:hypothetical protein